MQISLAGAILALLFLAPVALTLTYFPENFPPDFKPRSAVFFWLEHIGFYCCILCLAFSDNLVAYAKFNIYFVLMVASYAVCVGLWFRYYNEGQDILLLYESFWHIPIPLHVFLMVSIFCCCLWTANPAVGIFCVFYSIGGIANATFNYNQVK